jgi:hypothetical protein
MCDRLGGVLAFPAARPGADSLLHMCRAAPEACSVAGDNVNATRIRAGATSACVPGSDRPAMRDSVLLARLRQCRTQAVTCQLRWGIAHCRCLSLPLNLLLLAVRPGCVLVRVRPPRRGCGRPAVGGAWWPPGAGFAGSLRVGWAGGRPRGCSETLTKAWQPAGTARPAKPVCPRRRFRRRGSRHGLRPR